MGARTARLAGARTRVSPLDEPARPPSREGKAPRLAPASSLPTDAFFAQVLSRYRSSNAAAVSASPLAVYEFPPLDEVMDTRPSAGESKSPRRVPGLSRWCGSAPGPSSRRPACILPPTHAAGVRRRVSSRSRSSGDTCCCASASHSSSRSPVPASISVPTASWASVPPAEISRPTRRDEKTCSGSGTSATWNLPSHGSRLPRDGRPRTDQSMSALSGTNIVSAPFEASLA